MTETCLNTLAWL